MNHADNISNPSSPDSTRHLSAGTSVASGRRIDASLLLWTRGRDEKPVGVLSHETALSYFDLGDFNPPKVHITVPAGFRRNSQPPKAVVLHRSTVTRAETTLMRGMPICRASRALCDVVLKNVLALEECRQLVKEARRRGLILDIEIEAAKANPKYSAIAGKLFP